MLILYRKGLDYIFGIVKFRYGLEVVKYPLFHGIPLILHRLQTR